MALTIEEVRHIARLARLRLTPDEEQRYAEQLSAILDYAARLSRVDTSAIPPTAGMSPFAAPLRTDDPRASLARERALANAPAAEDGFFRVPPVLES
ncbi:MAG TPA: Asp-tRNA(Asn)/Glu-tRNA(Gln) amidotransferase subunit GatC [Anaerolineales bacterium]|nr:Asp-tRNA(Asn)/Glu-tRNA(Gln) amidotransferase subunit GatC [Anaerolineales bacterium]